MKNMINGIINFAVKFKYLFLWIIFEMVKWYLTKPCFYLLPDGTMLFKNVFHSFDAKLFFFLITINYKVEILWACTSIQAGSFV